MIAEADLRTEVVRLTDENADLRGEVRGLLFDLALSQGLRDGAERILKLRLEASQHPRLRCPQCGHEMRA